MDKPPDKRFIIFLVLLAVAVLIAWVVSGLIFAQITPQKRFVALTECSYAQPNLVYVPTTYVLGVEVDETLYEIIKCESNFNPTACNQKYGCGSGMGLCQFIKSTWLETIDRMGELLPERCRNMEAVFNGKCNLTACQWLYKTDGDIHWRAYSGNCYLNGENDMY